MIDGRKSSQRFKNYYGLNDVYCHKNGKDNYAVGINGTSNHVGGLSKQGAEHKVREFQNKKG